MKTDTTSMNEFPWTPLLEKALDRLLLEQGYAPPQLRESIRYSVLSGGKRIRPRLLLASGSLLELNLNALLPAALSLELIHCFTLIHDDLPCMDNDDFRRGIPSNHKAFGESIALLAGDALIPLALELFLECDLSPSLLLKGLRRFLGAIGARGVVGGQAAEPLLHTQRDLDFLKQVHSMKTGALFKAALLIPLDFSGIEQGTVQEKTLSHFANTVGLAFQVADDLEDRETNPTSILSYLSAQDAYQATSSDLNQASKQLEECWGPAALPLKELSDEIISKMENTLDH